jgi:hypothetical protein
MRKHEYPVIYTSEEAEESATPVIFPENLKRAEKTEKLEEISKKGNSKYGVSYITLIEHTKEGYALYLATNQLLTRLFW